jgi:uncharacterized protein involved in exopolysaccharide biosynthesis/Mrp family chromosome partitioning ATPase
MSSDYQTSDAGTGQSSGLAITDVYFVLFRRKWVVLIGALCGLLVAGAMWKLKQPLFQSEAKLLVKYVADTPALVPLGTDLKVQYPDESGAAVLNSEIEILESVDILQQVAKTVGPGRILPKGADPNDVDRASGVIAKKLRAQPLQRSKILRLEFFHANPEVAQQVLHELIEAYLKKHDDVHRALGISDATLNEQRDQLRTNLALVERELKSLKDKAGVHSLEETKKENIKQESSIRTDLFNAQAELAQHQASYDEVLRQQPTTAAPGTTTTMAPQEKIEEYKILVGQINTLTRKLEESSGQTGASPVVATNQIKLQEARARKASLETNYPALVRLTATPALPFMPLPTTQPTMDLASLGVLVKASQSRTATLSNQLEQVRGEMRRIEEAETGINDLQRQRANLEKQLAFVEQTLVQSRYNSNPNDRQNTSISKVQAPSPPYRDFGQLRKKMVMAVAGGLIAGLVLAFIVELVLDRSLKRPKDIEGLLQIPLFLSIPVLRHDSSSRAAIGNGASSDKDQAKSRRPTGNGTELQTEVVSAPAPDQEMKPYHDALRDRLVTYFDIRDMTHKPKLIAVTGCKDEAGVTSVASGLAASLSETGDGNVLLVDMRGQKGVAHAFARGKPACGLAEALENETRNSALVHENLYVVSAGSIDHKLQRIIPQQFSHFVPKLKASDYDYIIFDMPPVGQTSITAKVARFMDMVLMVIESEKTDRDVAKRAGDLLAESKASVAAVLNKRRRYVPAWLHQEFH